MFPLNYSIIIAYAILAEGSGGGVLASIRGDFSSHKILFDIITNRQHS